MVHFDLTILHRRFLENQFSLALRGRLVTYAYHLYFKSQTYYRVSNLDSRLENADHCLTDDVSDFTAAVAHLYSHMSKPFLDSIMFSVQLLRVSCGFSSTYRAYHE